MTSIDPAAQLTVYLRSQLAGLQRTAPVGLPAHRSSQSSAPSTSRGHTRPGHPAAPPREDLAQAIARRVSVIEPADPDRRRKVFRVFLESMLLEEWGAQLINDPAFYQLVETVHSQMAADARLQSLMDQAADRLLPPPAGG
jgi:hypothetical protein